MKKFIFSLVGISFLGASLFAAEVNVYSHRHYDADKQLFKEFEKETGIKVNVVTAKANELIARLKLEGKNTPADVLITADVGNLYKATSDDLLQSIESKILTETVPKHLRDGENRWYGLTKRARVLVYNPEKLDPKAIENYESLVDKDLKGKIVVRSSSNIYNQSLLASIIANDGKEEALKWAEGVVANMARAPKGNDRDQIRAVVAGIGDVAIVNTYYLGIMSTSKDAKDREIAQSVKVMFPNQDNRGTHINISGGGVTKYAKNKDEAIKLLEFLVSPKAQEVFAEANHEYPVNSKVAPSKLVSSWGSFKEDPLSLEVIGELNTEAVETFDKAGWK